MDGILNIYKPEGITSFDVVRNLRKLTGEKKIGHTGTLDPLASGILPICIGKGTKIVDYIMKNEKVYKAQLTLGIVTDTYDREGTIIKENPLVNLTEEKIVQCINSFKGDIYQVPPMYSAIKVNGKRLYDLARKGIEIEREARKINISYIEIENISLPNITFKVKCSKGTYIRSLCYDIGEKLGCGAFMNALERQESGAFNLGNCVNLENLTKENVENFLINIPEALKEYPTLNVKDNFSKLLINGVAVKDPKLTSEVLKEDEIYRVYSENMFIGLGRKSSFGFKIIKLLI